MYLMGIDVGTSGCKVALFDTCGKVAKLVSREYGLIYPHSGWMELDPQMVMDSVINCIKECCAEGIGGKVKALAVSTQGEAMVPVSAGGKPLYNAIVTFDNRNISEYQQFSSQFGSIKFEEMTGIPVHPMYSVTKLMWLKNHAPEAFEKADKFLCFGGLVSGMLGAGPVIDYTMACHTLAFDINDKKWSEEILNWCGISADKLPKAVEAGTVIGKVSKKMAELTGLSSDTIIVAGSHDQVCCAIGAGVVGSGVAMDSLGTTESILCVSSKKAQPGSGMPCYLYAIDGLYNCLTFLSSSASILKWFKDSIACDITPYNEFDKKCTKINRPGELLLMPHFAGSGTPYLDFNSKGLIYGLTLGTQKEDLYLSVMEGTAYEARLNMENMLSAGIEIHEFRCIGGGSNSSLWMQIKADITGRQMTSMEVSEAGCLGAAMLASVGAGVYGTCAEATTDWVRVKRVYEPDLLKNKLYNEKFEKYLSMYSMSKELR